MNDFEKMERVAEKIRDALNKNSDQAEKKVLESLRVVAKRLERQIEGLLADIQGNLSAGAKATPAQLFQQNRLSRLHSQIELAIAQSSIKLGEATTEAQRNAVDLALAQARDLGSVSETLSSSLARFDEQAVRGLIGLASNKMPLASMFERIGATLAPKVESALIFGLSTGRSSRQIASEIKRAIGTTTAHALTIARTETNGAFREATRELYDSTGSKIKKYVWLSARDLRTCPLCWSLHGRKFSTKVKFDTHPNCRCTLVPDLGTKVETGDDLFEELSDGQRLTILGKGRAELYKTGKFRLSDFVGERDGEFGKVRFLKRLDSFSSGKTSKPLLKPKPVAKPAPKTVTKDLSAKEIRGEIAEIELRYKAKFEEFDQKLLSLREASSREYRLNGFSARMKEFSDEAREISNRREGFRRAQLGEIRKLLAVQNPGKIAVKQMSRFNAVEELRISQAVDWIESIIDRSLFDKRTIYFKKTRSRRSHCDFDEVSLTKLAPVESIVHEIGHAFEMAGGKTDGAILARVEKFYARRTAGEKSQFLRDLTGQSDYGKEKTKPDKFFSPYCGKTYHGAYSWNKKTRKWEPRTDKKLLATEIVSMGLEEIFTNPIDFAKSDPDYFDFMINLMRGL